MKYSDIVWLAPVPYEDGTKPELPQRHTFGAVGYDLALAEEERWFPDQVRIARIGMRLAEDLDFWPCAWPAPYAVGMLVLPRGSTFLKHGLLVVNSPGLVDPDYTEEIGVILWRPPRLADTQEPLVLPKGTRVAQAVFAHLSIPDIKAAEANPRRIARGGFGHTGGHGG